MIEDPRDDETRYTSVEDYDNQLKSKSELANIWKNRIEAANKSYKGWSDRFKVEMLYQYYEGFQWFFEVDENNRPYVINMIYSTIETKLPNLLFDNPQFNLRARPIGLEFDEESANRLSQVKEDALNYVCMRPEFGLSDKHELSALDSFFGFGVIETGCSSDLEMNPNIPLEGKVDPLDTVYCKQIPYDTFRVSSNANWDLSTGKWYGYFEFIPWERLKAYKESLNYPNDVLAAEAGDFSNVMINNGKIEVATDSNKLIGPSGTCKIWKIWDFETGKFLLYAPDNAKSVGDSILAYKDFEYDPITTLRFGKRRKGWYPYPPVWNWISPQDELNDSRQAQRLHRKRFTRKYEVLVGALESEEELDKFLYGPDGTVIKVLKSGAITPIADAPLDPVSPQSIMMTYDDFNRISGTSDSARGQPVGDRTTAREASIMDRNSQIRDSKDSLRVADFMCSIGRNILRALRQTKKSFWIKAKLTDIEQEGPMKELKSLQYKWKQIPPQALKDDDYDVDLTISSVSPISAQQDKTAFMEFLAMITQYEILAFSPALLREAAYRTGYKNEAVLNQFQQLAQLAAIGRMAQAKQQSAAMIQGPQGPQPTQPGQLAAQQMDTSTPPDNQSIMNTIFNRTGVQQPQ